MEVKSVYSNDFHKTQLTNLFIIFVLEKDPDGLGLASIGRFGPLGGFLEKMSNIPSFQHLCTLIQC